MSYLRSVWTSAAGRMKLLFVLICAVSAVYEVSAYSTISAESQLVQTVGVDASKSVFIAGQIKMNAARAGAAAAAAFQPGQVPTDPEPGKKYCDPSRSAAFIPATQRDFYELTCKLNNLIGLGYTNVTYETDVVLANGNKTNERASLDQISSALSNYNRMVERAFANRNMLNPVDLSYLRAATEYMTALEIAAQDLVDVNDQALNDQFSSRETSSKIHLGTLIASGLVLVGLMWYLNSFMKGIFRRRVNGPIALAAVVVLAMTGWVSYALISVDRAMTSAKNDSYNSEYHTYSTLADALMMNTHQTLYLLKRGGDQVYEQRFNDAAGRISNAKPDEMETLITRFNDQQLDLVKSVDVSWKGALGEELRNITFKGERRAAVDSARWLGNYLRINNQVRQLVQSGHQEDAITLFVGTKEGQSGFAFQQVEKSLTRVLTVNDTEFKSSVSRGFGALNWLSTGVLALLLVSAGLTFGGLRSRLALLKL